jgi:hypothetical protein
VTPTPQRSAEGRRPAPLAVVTERTTFDLDDAAARYVLEVVSQAAAEPAAKAAARKRVSRARGRLAALEGGGQAVQRVHVALAHESGRILRLAKTAELDLRPFVASLAVRFVAYLREHDPKTTKGIARMYSSAASDALAGALEEQLFRLGFRVMSATRTRVEDGTRLTLGLPAVEALMKMRLACLSAARLDFLAAMQAEAGAEGGLPRQSDPLGEHPLLQARRNRVTVDLNVAPTPPPKPRADEGEPEADADAPDAAVADVEPPPVGPAVPVAKHCGQSRTHCWRPGDVAGHCACRCTRCGNPPPPPRPGDEVRREGLRRQIADREATIAAHEGDPESRPMVAGLRANLVLLREQLAEIA